MNTLMPNVNTDLWILHIFSYFFLSHGHSSVALVCVYIGPRSVVLHDIWICCLVSLKYWMTMRSLLIANIGIWLNARMYQQQDPIGIRSHVLSQQPYWFCLLSSHSGAQKAEWPHKWARAHLCHLDQVAVWAQVQQIPATEREWKVRSRVEAPVYKCIRSTPSRVLVCWWGRNSLRRTAYQMMNTMMSEACIKSSVASVCVSCWNFRAPRRCHSSQCSCRTAPEEAKPGNPGSGTHVVL